MLQTTELSIVCGRGQCDLCISGCCCSCHGTGDASSSPMMAEKCEECNGTGLHPARRGYTYGMNELKANSPEIPDSSTAPESLERADWRGVLALVDNYPFPVRKSALGGATAPDDPMDPEEILRRSEAFDPTPKPNRERIMRLALEMILAQCNCYTEYRAHIVDPMRRTAQQALRECGK